MVSQLSTLKAIVGPAEELAAETKDLQELFDLAIQSDKDEIRQLENDWRRLSSDVSR